MQIGLALSGGGIRAAVFHLGVLRRLADENLLENVSQLSTVSGGTLVAAVLITSSGMQWPTSVDFRNHLYLRIRQVLTTTDLFSFKAFGWTGLLTSNIKLFRHRAEILAERLERRWGVAGSLRDLPDKPVWWINTTCVETGKNWRFSKREMGDWQFGRHYAPPFRVAEAAAASAAVPYVIGALTLSLPPDGWYRTDPPTRQPIESRRPPTEKVHLWDGGAYENLGLETLFKPRQGLLGCDFLICSDASGPLPPAGKTSPWSILRGHLVAPRLFDVCSDQIRSLRTRMFVWAIGEGTVKGALLRMGNSVRDVDIKAGRLREQATYDLFQEDQHVAVAFEYPTDLKAISKILFDRIARHGYELADATLTTYCPRDFARSYHWT
jgi:NTE family protein